MLVFKWGSIISNDSGGNPIKTNDMVQDELGHLDTDNECKGNNFHPFGEVFYCNNDKLVSI